MNIRLLSWNINSVRLRIDSLKKIIKIYKPNVVCLQETKCPNELFPFKDLETLGLSNIHTNGIKGYHGVCIATDLPVNKVEQKVVYLMFIISMYPLAVMSPIQRLM